MTTQQKRIIFIAAAVILIGLVVLLIYLFFFRKEVTPPVSNININKTLPFNPLLTNGEVSGFKTPGNQDISVPTSEEVQVKTLALNYSEKFGSYSNQSNLANFSDLLTASTLAMQNYLDNLMREINSESDNYYHGYTTKALKVKIISLTDSQSETLVTTQRQEINESQNILNRVYYQDLKLKLIKSNNQWLVDGAWWQ